jgi:hypothetical protein
MDKEVILQIFSGGFAETPATFESIMQKLEPIVSRIRVSKVFMGMSVDTDLYARIRDYLYKNDIEFYFCDSFNMRIFVDTIRICNKQLFTSDSP